MNISYTPGEASANAVANLHAFDNRFIVPSTFSEAHTLEQCVCDYGKPMETVDNLRLVNSYFVLAGGDRVCVLYSAEEHQ